MLLESQFLEPRLTFVSHTPAAYPAVLELKNGEIIEAEFANDSIVRILHNGVPENDTLFADPRIQAILPLNDVLGMTTDTNGQYECVTLDTTEIDLREDFFIYKCKHNLDWPNELVKMRNGLFACLKILRHTYRFYACLGVDRTADNTQLLQRMQFWQFLRDCRLPTSMSICQVLNILVKGFGDCDASRKMFQPFEPMFFSEFTSSIAILAVTLFHEYDTASRAPHEAVKHFVDKFVSRNACVPLGGVYAQPQRTAVLTPYFNDLYKLFEICPGTLSFSPKDEVMTVRIFVKILQLSFLEFVEIIINCAETTTRNEEKKRPKTSMHAPSPSRQGTIECISRGSVDIAGASEGHSIPRTKSDFKNTTRLTEKERRRPPTEGEKEVTAARRISTNQNTNSKVKSRRETSTTQRGKKERPDSSINKLQSRRRGSHSLKSEQDVPAQDSSDQDGELSRQGTTLKKETETEVPPFLRWQQMVKTFITERLLAQAEVQLDKWSGCIKPFLVE
ncbi:Cadherin member 2 [Sparganum proliferum]